MPKIPAIATFFETEALQNLYAESIKQTLRKIFPSDFFKEGDLKKKVKDSFPFVLKMGEASSFPMTLSFYSVSHFRANAFKFFFEMVSKWLVPGERLNVTLIYALDFKIPALSDNVYTLCEIMVKIDNEETFKQIDRVFPLIEKELRLGLESKYHAMRIQQIKGINFDDKTAFIQEHIANVSRRLSAHFDNDVYAEMQNFFLLAPESFKDARSPNILSRIILSHYLFRKDILKYLNENNKNRKTLVKIFRMPHSIGISIGLSLFMEKEVFEERQFMQAIRHFYPQAKVIEGSFLMNRKGQELLTTAYIEICKDTPFTFEEVKGLKQDLTRDLKSYVEHMMNQVFMPRNEEEIMRNILTLSGQFKYSRDLPQVFITFDQQSRLNLFFTVILVRIKNENSKSISDLLKGSFLKYIHDRTKVVGRLRKKYAKEATVFRVKFNKEEYLRLDMSIDLYKARQAVVNELNRLIGDFRDFNGGMIHKQNELFQKVQNRLNDEKVRYSSVILENFFYSLTPVIMQTILEAQALAMLFKMFNDTLKRGLSHASPFISKLKADDDFVYVLFAAHDRSQNDQFYQLIHDFEHTSTELATADLKMNDLILTGYIYRSEEESKRHLFTNKVETALKNI